MASDEELVRTYLEYYRTKDEALSWAFGEVYELTCDEPERAWTVAKALVRSSEDEETLFYVAAGPLEDILCKHGPQLWPRVHEDARKDPRLRRALGGVWGRNRMEPKVWDDLQAFVGPVPASVPPKKRK